jgi:prepilin-type N-terminal cleavage/methylation domain-containing protein
MPRKHSDRFTQQPSQQPYPLRSGFTLVEMLVSVALVLLMMTLFSSIFSMATNSVATQRGISQNDQRARALTTLIRADFAHRTFRYPLPFAPGENAATSPTPFSNRSGYLYISTNDPYSGLDDLVQFTVSSDILTEDPDSSPYFGKAQMLSDRDPNTPAGLRTNMRANTNQPEADDGSLQYNNTGSSSGAEVAYFVRNGNLYRRVLLLRDPLPVAGRQLNEQPLSVRGNPFFGHADGRFWFDSNSNGTVDANELSDDFWRLFDYSAISSAAGARFVGLSALNNETPIVAAGDVLADPRSRFGFNPVTFQSREHTLLNNNRTGLFLGRFLHAETSASNFNWPQRVSNQFGSTNPLGNGNPFDIVNTPLTLNTTTGVVQEYSENVRGGPRRMEDLLLAGVHELKVEIWDERLQKYTTPGHLENHLITSGNNTIRIPGDYHQQRRVADEIENGNAAPQNDFLPDTDDWGPEGRSVGVFDTWHPGIDRLSQAGFDPPPYIPLRYTPPLFPLGPTRPGINGVVINPNAEPDRQTGRADNRGYWQPNTPYQLGDIVFVPWTDSNTDGLFAWSELPEPKFQIALRCVATQNTATSAATPPTFPSTPGSRVRELNNDIEWESFDNRRPLRSIRLTIRYHDQSTDTQRTLSLVIPTTDKK